MFGFKKTKRKLTEILFKEAELLDQIIREQSAMRREVVNDYICGGWITQKRDMGLSISKLPEGYNALIYKFPLRARRNDVRRVFIDITEGIPSVRRGHEIEPLQTDSVAGTITLPGIGTFHRDDLILK